MATYDPVSTATALAENYVYARQTQLDSSTTKVQSQTQALTTLKSSLTAFTSALSSVSSKGSVIAQTATVSAAEKLSATASAQAAEGSYSFTVQQLAKAQQSLFEVSDLGLAAGAEADTYKVPQPSKLAVSVGSDGFYTVDLSVADANNDGELSVSEIARAINDASEGKVTAAVITQNGKQQLLLNGTQMGEEGRFTLSKFDADGAKVEVSGTQLAAAQNAKFKLGGDSGIEISQSSNTYTGIAGMSVEFKAVSATDPVTVTVARDTAATTSKMQSFVDSYNTLLKSISKLTQSGNSETGVTAGALSSDSSVRSLRNQLNSLLRTSVDGVSLVDYGISAQRDGTIALDSTKFTKKLTANPDALTSLLGASNTLEYKRSGVLGSMQTYVESWTKSTGGHLQARQTSLQGQLTQLEKQQTSIDRMYEQAYQRYLLQFSTLSSIEDQMSSTTSMLSSMFASSSS